MDKLYFPRKIIHFIDFTNFTCMQLNNVFSNYYFNYCCVFGICYFSISYLLCYFFPEERPIGLIYRLICSVFVTVASLVTQTVKNPPAVQETWVRSLGQEDPLEKSMAPLSSVLAWRIPWAEGPGGLQFMGSQKVGHD